MALLRQMIICESQNFNTLEVVINELLKNPKFTELLKEKLEQVELVIVGQQMKEKVHQLVGRVLFMTEINKLLV